MLSNGRPRGRAKQGRLSIVVASVVATATFGGAGAMASSGGGIGAPSPPEVTDVTCQSRCAGLRDATVGSRVALTGRNLDYVTQVRFPERGGGRVAAAARDVTASRVEAVVPERAATGKPQAVDSAGNVSPSPAELRIVSSSAVASQAGAGVSDVSADPAKGFFAGKKQATASFVAQGRGPQDVRVDVIGADGGVVRSIVKENVPPQSPAKARWNGKAAGGGVAPNGEYRFEVRPLAGGGTERAGFEQYDHIFPVRGKHQYWDGLGAGRGHQGVDVGAACGKRMVAARGGKVEWRAFHSRAGNYLVIDGKKTNVDYAYMHLQKRSKLREGERVKTGETIGRVGDTGSASGCHLHFEMWKGEWQGGGSVMDPMPALKRWDKWS